MDNISDIKPGRLVAGNAAREFSTELIRTLSRYDFPAKQLPTLNLSRCVGEPEQWLSDLSEKIRESYTFPILRGLALAQCKGKLTPLNTSDTLGEVPKGYRVHQAHPWYAPMCQIADDASCWWDDDYLGYPVFLPMLRPKRKRPVWVPLVATNLYSPWDISEGIAVLNDHDYMEGDGDIEIARLRILTFKDFAELAVKKCCPQWADSSVYDKNREPWRALGGSPIWPGDCDTVPGLFLTMVGRAETELEAYPECLKFGRYCLEAKKLRKEASEVTGMKKLPLESEYAALPFETRMKVMRLITDAARAEYAKIEQRRIEKRQVLVAEMRKGQDERS